LLAGDARQRIAAHRPRSGALAALATPPVTSRNHLFLTASITIRIESGLALKPYQE